MEKNKDTAVITTQPLKRDTLDLPTPERKVRVSFDDTPQIRILHSVENFVSRPIPGVPAGLESLYVSEDIFIAGQKFIPEYANLPHFALFDSMGRRLYYAVETTSTPTNNTCICFGFLFSLSVLNFNGLEVFHVKGELGCCYSMAEVLVGNDNETYGSFAQSIHCSCRGIDNIKLKIRNKHGHVEFIVKNANNGTNEIIVYQSDGKTQIGKITRDWGEDHIMDKKYGISFPKKLEVHFKAILVGAALLIYFLANRHGDNKKDGESETAESSSVQTEPAIARRHRISTKTTTTALLSRQKRT